VCRQCDGEQREGIRNQGGFLSISCSCSLGNGDPGSLANDTRRWSLPTGEPDPFRAPAWINYWPGEKEKKVVGGPISCRVSTTPKGASSRPVSAFGGKRYGVKRLAGDERRRARKYRFSDRHRFREMGTRPDHSFFQRDGKLRLS